MNSKKMVLTALLIAVVTVTTMVVNIPLPGVKGYVNIGDTVVLLAGLILDPLWGPLAAPWDPASPTLFGLCLLGAMDFCH